jgi:hypothetical protein
MNIITNWEVYENEDSDEFLEIKKQAKEKAIFEAKRSAEWHGIKSFDIEESEISNNRGMIKLWNKQ